jgi:hypothetical protein
MNDHELNQPINKIKHERKNRKSEKKSRLIISATCHGREVSSAPALGRRREKRKGMGKTRKQTKGKKASKSKKANARRK